MKNRNTYTLNFSELRQASKPGQCRATPGKILLWNILDNNVPLSCDLMYLRCRQFHEVWKVNDEENQATLSVIGITSSREVMTGAAIDVVALNQLLDILEHWLFQICLHKSESLSQSHEIELCTTLECVTKSYVCGSALGSRLKYLKVYGTFMIWSPIR